MVALQDIPLASTSVNAVIRRSSIAYCASLRQVARQPVGCLADFTSQRNVWESLPGTRQQRLWDWGFVHLDFVSRAVAAPSWPTYRPCRVQSGRARWGGHDAALEPSQP